MDLPHTPAGIAAAGRDAPLMLTSVLGQAHDPWWAGRLHLLEHQGRLEQILIPAADAARRRMRLRTDQGRDCAIALERGVALLHGAVLHCSADLAIVLRLDSGVRLRLRPQSLADGMRIGHWCGNLHWKLVFGPDWLDVIVEGPEQRYLDRLHDLAGLACFDVGPAP